MEDLMSKISIIIPVYNADKYLSKCLSSLLGQSFTDWEAICVNDGSTDNSLDILQEYAKKDSRIKLLIQDNQGLSQARNNALKIAQGDYISFLDADDWINDDYLQGLYNAIIEHDACIAVSVGIRKYKSHIRYRIYHDKQAVFENLADKIKACNMPHSSYVWGKLYKRELLENFEFAKGMYFEDMMWLPEVVLKSKLLVVVPEAVYYYRANPNSIVKTAPCNKKQENFYKAKKYTIEFFKKHNLPLPENYEKITKRQWNFAGICWFKIKELKETKTYYLLGFIPVFKKRCF